MHKRYEHLFLALGIVLCLAVYYAQFFQPGIYKFFKYRTVKDRYAYATFLSSGGNETETEDRYVTATRVLGYQIMHHPDTRSKKNIPLLVLMPPHVPPSVRGKLLSEGIQVVLVDNLLPKSWNISPSETRWKDQFTKLRLFEMTQYDRIVYMDNDMLLTHSLDGIFGEPEVVTAYHTKNKPKNVKEDETELPSSYLIAGVADNGGPGPGHPVEVTNSSRLNGGFFVLKPCKTLFAYYQSVLEHHDRFDTGFMEMGLLNYAHRVEKGNMPWKTLSPGKWSSNWPTKEDLDRGSATLHDKFWDHGNSGWVDRRLVEMWWRVQGQMEGYWLGRTDGTWMKSREGHD
jgi:alpha-N-acetylglucosamine transferase